MIGFVSKLNNCIKYEEYLLKALPKETWPVFDSIAHEAVVDVIQIVMVGPICLDVVNFKVHIRGNSGLSTSSDQVQKIDTMIGQSRSRFWRIWKEKLKYGVEASPVIDYKRTWRNVFEFPRE